MPTSVRFGLSLSLFVASVASANADDFDPKPLDELVAKAMTAFHVPGAAVVVVKDDKVVYLRGFGVKKQGEDDKVTPETVFAIASCSKAFTGTAAAMLVADGKLGWDDLVRKHLPNFRLADESADREVTVRDLLCHRTGMPRHDMLWSGGSEDSPEVVRRFGMASRSTSFRSKWEYSNVPFTAASLIVGRVGGSDWATVTRERIFKPLDMKSSYCTGAEAAAAKDRATPHYLKVGGELVPVDWDRTDHTLGAGCIASTARDLGNWLRFQLANGKFDGKTVLEEKHLKETRTPQMVVTLDTYFRQFYPAKVTNITTYGLGWFVHDYRGHACASHGGTLTGFRAQCMLLPEKKAGVFVVSNLRPSLFPETVAKATLDLLLGWSDDDWVKFHKGAQGVQDFIAKNALGKRTVNRKPDTKPSREAKAYAGTYEHPAYGTATVTADGDKLTLKWGKFTLRLDHYHFDTFTGVPIEPKKEVLSFDRTVIDVSFRLGTDGEVASMEFVGQDYKKQASK